MIKYILVPASGLDGDEQAFAAALAIARRDGAHLNFLHARADVTALVVAIADGGFGSGGFIESVTERFEADAAEQAMRARTMVTTFCSAHGVALGGTQGSGLSAEFTEETGDPAALVVRHGRFADLVVVRRPAEGQFPIGLIETVVTSVGRPVLIAGAKAAVPEVVVIAWKDSPEAARAVTGALAFVERARRVVILCVAESGDASAEHAEPLRRALSWRNPAVEVLAVPRGERETEAVILAAAGELGADLLVMGAYGHGRLREFVFGGVSRHVLDLASTDTAVLMMH